VITGRFSALGYPTQQPSTDVSPTTVADQLDTATEATGEVEEASSKQGSLGIKICSESVGRKCASGNWLEVTFSFPTLATLLLFCCLCHCCLSCCYNRRGDGAGESDEEEGRGRGIRR
jgi:hypothetical protein